MSADSTSLKCPNCGAPAQASSPRFGYCRALLATISCPSCFGLLFDGAAFCQGCGAARSRTVQPEGQHVKCPACRGAMQWVRVGDVDLLECAACQGIWVEAETFERVCADREAQAAVLHTGDRKPAAPDARAPIRYRPCPRCGKLMNRVNFGRISAAIVDVCKGHGTFLDNGELHQIVRFMQAGGIERARAAEKEQLIEEQRRLRDLERMQARLAPRDETSSWNDSTLKALLSALTEKP